MPGLNCQGSSRLFNPLLFSIQQSVISDQPNHNQSRFATLCRCSQHWVDLGRLGSNWVEKRGRGIPIAEIAGVARNRRQGQLPEMPKLPKSPKFAPSRAAMPTGITGYPPHHMGGSLDCLSPYFWGMSGREGGRQLSCRPVFALSKSVLISLQPIGLLVLSGATPVTGSECLRVSHVPKRCLCREAGVGSYNPLLNAFSFTFCRGCASGVANAIATDQPACANTIRLPFGTRADCRETRDRVGRGKARV